jgi:hypothetical protein
VTARTLGFGRTDLMEMPFDELCLVWLPEIERLAKEGQA